MKSSNSSNSKVKMYFFPYIAGGHLLPMIDIARFFASCHPNVQATIITTPKTALLFQSSIDFDRQAGYDISFHTLDLGLPDEDENFLDPLSHHQRTKVLTAFKNLKKPLEMLLTDSDSRPDCFVCDLMHSWTLDIADEATVPWVVFHSTSLFLLWAEDYLTRVKPHHNVGSDDEPFLLGGPGNDQVWFTRSRLPVWHRSNNGETKEEFLPINLIRKTCKRSYAMVVNTCFDFEGEYRSAAQNAVGARWVCMVGPVSLYSTRTVGDTNVQSSEKESILEWLGSKQVNSVVYVSFGTEANLSKEQFHEIAYGLEGSSQPFIWIVRPNLFKDQGEEGWFPEGFEARIKESNQGLIIKGWAPQLVILSHVNLGAFVTHCGWNSSLEGISNGVPMITWPLTLDQFYIESFMVDVMKVGIRVGNEEWVVSNAPPKVTVTRDKLEAAVMKMLSGGEEVDEMRRKVKEYAKKCRMAIQQGGSSYQDAYSLVEELKALKEGNGKENI